MSFKLCHIRYKPCLKLRNNTVYTKTKRNGNQANYNANLCKANRQKLWDPLFWSFECEILQKPLQMWTIFVSVLQIPILIYRLVNMFCFLVNNLDKLIKLYILLVWWKSQIWNILRAKHIQIQKVTTKNFGRKKRPLMGWRTVVTVHIDSRNLF